MRTTAAKQLAQLAVKSVTSDVTLVEDDVKSNRQQASQVDRSAWNDLMSVVARVSFLTEFRRNHTNFDLADTSFPPLKIFRYSHGSFSRHLTNMLSLPVVDTLQQYGRDG